MLLELPRPLQLLARALVGAVALASAACSSLPPRPAAPPSHAVVEDGSTTLGRVARASVPAGFASGFQPLPIASAAYETRLALAGQAERSIDMQTFVFDADDTGLYLLGRLRAAAARGVRVRLLVDDFHSSGNDGALAALADEPNAEVRLFNPFAAGRSSLATRLLTSLHDIGRINHRMHNKLFVADNALAVFGGRNTGDHYFMRAATGNFVDYDVLGAGAVAAELSASFDAYWNSAAAWPIRAVVPRRAAAIEAAQRQRIDAAEPPPLDETVPMRLQRYVAVPTELSAGRVTLVGALARVVADPVDKVEGSRLVDRAGTVRAFVSDVMRSAAREVFVVTPYFVPGELGMEAMRLLRARGVRLRLLTNSLAATDEPVVHAGYLRYRREMLEIGVEIYELSPSLARETASLGRFGSSLGQLHAKIVIVDRERFFVGSMNLDSRSERYNTELGVLIESPVLAADFLDMMRFESSAWRVSLDPASGAMRWTAGSGAGQRTVSSEPEASWWLQMKSRLLGSLVPEGWL